jgi:hypothetical protein
MLFCAQTAIVSFVEDMQAVIRQLQDTDIVMAGIRARQAEVLKSHGEWLEQNELWMTRHREAVAKHEVMMAKHDDVMAKHDLTMIEIEDKLNGLIGVVDDLVRNRKRE